MKKILLTSILISLTFTLNDAASSNLTKFSNTLKTQQKSIANNCETQTLKANPNINKATKKTIKLYCACIAENTTNNHQYVEKMFKVAKNSKNEKEYIGKMEEIGIEIGKFCEQKTAIIQ